MHLGRRDSLGLSWGVPAPVVAAGILTPCFPEWHGAKPQTPQSLSIPHGNQAIPRTWHVSFNRLCG